MFFSGLHGNDLCPSMSLTSQLGSYAISWLIPTRWSYPVLLPSHPIITSPVVPQWMDPKPVRCAKIVAQHLVRRSNFPCDSVELWDRSDWWITWPRRKETWRELDPYRHTYTYMYIYVYLRMLTHICSYNMHMLVLSIFVCVNVCVSI